MQKHWLFFWISGLAAVLAFGFWRAAVQEADFETRGYELATRQEEMPLRLPLTGVNVELTQYENLSDELQKIADLGIVWLRQPFLWSEIEPESGVYQWEQYDKLVEAVAAFDGQLQLVALLDGTPRWARHQDAPEHPFAPPASPAAYGEFARAVAERYGDQIDFYQIWDEPNIEEHWGNLNPRPALYVAMLEAAYKNIHATDPDAMVIAAALAPNVEDGPDNINDPDYLRAIYELGGGDYFDAAAGKPYGFNLPPDDRTVNKDTLNFSRLILLREEMVRQGDGNKPLWGSNWGWNALPEGWTGEPSIWGQVTFFRSVDYTNTAFKRALREWPWVGGLILQHWQPDAPPDDPIQGFAIAPRADQWQGVVPDETIMHAGFYPAVNPYADYAGDWEFGELGADAGAGAEQNTITIEFEGTEFALSVRRGDYLSYLLVTIDGEPANALPRNNNAEAFIALTSPKREPTIDLILAAEHLSSGRHTVVITHRPELGDDQWPIVGFAVGTPPEVNPLKQNLALGVMGAALAAMILIGVRLPWGNLRLPSAASLRNIWDMGLGLVLSTIVMGGTLLTWHETITSALRRDLPTLLATLATSSVLYFSPSTWITLIALVILGVVIFSRPWVGVLQVLFWAAFYTSTTDALFRTIATVELMLGITA
ncbi:MAG: beta-galactosidase, partial [Anaerolineae bacterium]|nr:beta-galactosidase [Anaerolineae bacterium]